MSTSFLMNDNRTFCDAADNPEISDSHTITMIGWRFFWLQWTLCGLEQNEKSRIWWPGTESNCRHGDFQGQQNQ